MAVGIVAATVLGGSRAEACTCIDDTPDRPVIPASGASGVARNVRPQVVTSMRIEPEVRLHDAETGLEVETTELRFEGVVPFTNEIWTVLEPTDLLDPSHAYQVRVDGELVAAFETGTQVDDAPPAFPGLAAVSAEVHPYPESVCGTYTCAASADELDRLRLVYDDPPGDVALLVLELRSPGESDAWYRAPLAPRQYWNARQLQSEMCTTSIPQLEPGSVVCARLRAFDGAGNESPPADEACAAVIACPELSSEMTCLAPPSCQGPADDPGSVSPPGPGEQRGGCELAPAAGTTGSSGLAAWLGMIALVFFRPKRRPRRPAR